MKEEKVFPLFSEREIGERIESLAKEIAGVKFRDLMVVSLLRGGFMFTSDLIRALSKNEVHPKIDFMTLESYGTGRESREVKILSDIREEVKGKDVIVLDDILESGRTLAFATGLLRGRGASGIKIAVLLEKPGKRKVDINADFVGFKVEDKFIVGYGLDFASRFRELPFIGYIED